MSDLRRRIGGEVLVLDGGVGTELLAALDDPAAELPGGAPLDLLNATRPERVHAVHAAYLRAGCEAITTNSFLGTRPELEAHGLGARVRELSLAAARLARAAADEHARPDRPRYVLGSLGPGQRQAGSEVSRASLAAAYAEQASALAEGGVDGFLIETCRDPEQVRAALEGALAARRRLQRDLPLLVSFAPLSADDPRGADLLAAGVAALAPYPVELVALNCASGPLELAEPLAELARLCADAGGGRPLGAYPNAGAPVLEGVRPRYALGPGEFASALAPLVRRHALALVGGCCGTGPAHLAELVLALGRTPPRA